MNYERRQISETLLKIDEEASLTLGNTGMRFPVIIVGGSAFILRDLTNRPMTHDIDVLYSDEKLRDILQNYHAVNSAVMAYMDSIPYNFEDRLVRIGLETKAVDYYTPSTEDLAVMKLYGWRPNDREDLESPAFLNKVDWTLLDRLVYDPDEAQASALSKRRYDEMAFIYEEYAKEHGHVPHV